MTSQRAAGARVIEVQGKSLPEVSALLFNRPKYFLVVAGLRTLECHFVPDLNTAEHRRTCRLAHIERSIIVVVQM